MLDFNRSGAKTFQVKVTAGQRPRGMEVKDDGEIESVEERVMGR